LLPVSCKSSSRGRDRPTIVSQIEGQDAPHQGEVDAKHEQQNGEADSRDEVQYRAQPELADHALADEGQPLDVRVVGASARPQPVHEGRRLREQQHDHEDQEQVAQKAGDA
jgi:hypothetical protein